MNTASITSGQAKQNICEYDLQYSGWHCPKIWKISVSKEEEDPCRENFPVILENY